MRDLRKFCPTSTTKLKLPTIRLKFQIRTFICCRDAYIWKNSRLLLTSKTKLLMIFTPRIDSVLHVFLFENFRHCRPELVRLPTKKDVSHLSLQLVSQDRTQELFLHTIDPYIGFSRTGFQFCCLWTRVVSQGVVCLHGVGIGGSWTFTVIFFNVSRGSTLFVSLYISFAQAAHDE